MVKVLGNGSIETVKPGKVYRIRHSLGFDKETGKYITTPKRTVHGSKTKARELLIDWKHELESGHS